MERGRERVGKKRGNQNSNNLHDNFCSINSVRGRVCE